MSMILIITNRRASLGGVSPALDTPGGMQTHIASTRSEPVATATEAETAALT